MLTCLLKWNWYIICHHPSPPPDTTIHPPTSNFHYGLQLQYKPRQTQLWCQCLSLNLQVNYFIVNIKKNIIFQNAWTQTDSSCIKSLNLSNYAILIFVRRQLACFKLTLKPLFWSQIIIIKVNLISHLKMSKLRHLK